MATTETPTETEQERKVREEQEAHDREQEEAREKDAAAHEGETSPGHDALFDRKAYDDPKLQLPKIDGEGVDKIAVAFSGRVLLDRSDPADVELIRRMKLGQDITLMVEAKIAGKGHGYTTNKEGDLDAVVLETRAKVESVYQPVTPDS